MSKSSYVLPFKTVLRQLELGDDIAGAIELTPDQLFALIRNFLVYVPFDENWYLRTYPDVEQAIESGATKSAKDHFVMNGYFEGRKPGPVEVDVDFYLATYSDVADGIEYGEIESAQAHFDQHGFIEGRLPFKM
jgi:hypothetical protein